MTAGSSGKVKQDPKNFHIANLWLLAGWLNTMALCKGQLVSMHNMFQLVVLPSHVAG